MPVFGISGDPNLWLGELYREEPEGYLVDWHGGSRYLPKDLAYTPDTEWGDDATWGTWAQRFSAPAAQEGGAWSQTVKRREKPKAAPAGGMKVPPAYPSMLTIKVSDVVVIKGTELAGINVEEANVVIVDNGTGTITVKAS